MFSAEDLMIPLASMFEYEGTAPQEQRASSTRRSTIVQKDYKWVRMQDSAVSDFTIQYDKGVGKKEKDFYRSKYPLLDKVMEDRIHCTSCDTHLGTAPIDEVTIRQHPVLKVTQCSKCYAFYTSGEFDKGEDGSELYCRWCGQGGEVFCCAKCPYVFCKKCIVRNLTKNTIKDIIKNENWMCFACEPEITWGLRAKHWALMNFIEKQRKIILSQYVSDGDVNFLLSRDLTSCCQKEAAAAPPPKEAKKNVTPKTTPKPSPVLKPAQVMPQKTPLPKSAPKTRKRDTPDQVREPAAKRPRIEGEPESDIVCTPDILSMFEGNSAEANPPPLTQIRQYGASTNGAPPTSARTAAQKKTQTITIANQSPATPIYHTINGFRIDLNSAARQETIRLPNGKLIQVKKQSTPQQQPPMVPPLMSPGMRAVRPQMRPQMPRMPTGRPPRRQPNIMRPQMQPPTSSNQTRPLILNGMMQPQYNVPPLIISQQAANSPYGKAKTELDNRIRNGQEICMHIIGKMNTLVASNAYKSMKSVKDVKEIHIHLSYLLTYAINRFKTLQEKSMENMKTLGFGGDVESIMSGKITASTPEEGDDNDDDIEIVEPQTTLIDLASDEEEPLKEEETPKAKESQMFLDKLKMQPKILLKKLPGSAFAEAKVDKENEKIVKDILKEIMDKVMESMAPSEEDLEIVENGKKSSEEMEVDAPTISIEDEDSGDVVEVVDKVQSEQVPEDVDGEAEKTVEEAEKTVEEAEKTVEEAEKTVVEAEKEEDARDNQLNAPLEDVEMESKEGEEEKVEEKNDSEADVEMKEDTESAEVEEKESKDQEVVEETDKEDKEEVEEVKETENLPEDVDMEKGDKDLQEKEKDPEEDDICAPDEDEDEELKTPPTIPELPDLPDTEDDPEEVKSLGESPKVPEMEEEEDQDKEPKTDEETEEVSKAVMESPASPDSADFNKEVRAFEDIDSPDEFDDALDTPAAGADLLDDLVKPTDDFPDDLDSLGKFLDNQG